MTSIVKQFSSQIVDLSDWFGFNPFGWLTLTDPKGNFMAVAKNALTLAVVFMFVVWVIVIIVIALRLITAVGNPDNVGKAFTSLKNLFIGVTILFGFLIVLLLIASIFVP